MIDLTGRRFGRLVAIEPTDQRSGTSVIWRCRCDCGREYMAPARGLLHQGVRSCGCDRVRRCAVCGAEYAPTAYNQQRCPACVRARMLRCEACGTVFAASWDAGPRDRRLCPACLNKFRGDINTRAAHIQSDDARRGRAQAVSPGQKASFERACEAFKTHPATAKGSPENAQAKIWTLRAPDGSVVEVRNLDAFLRDRSAEFPSLNAARCSFHRISRSLRDPDGDFQHQYSYRGWTMDRPPEYPEDVQARRDYLAELERRRAERRRNGAPGYDGDAETGELR